MKNSKVVPIEKSTFVPGHGMVNYTTHEVQETNEIVSIPKVKSPPSNEENVKGIVANLRTWINKKGLNVDEVYN